MQMIRNGIKEDAGKIARLKIDNWRKTYSKIFPEDFLNNLDLTKEKEKYLNNLKEGIPRHTVHICIHGLNITLQHSLDKVIIVCLCLGKPSPHHAAEHEFHLIICQRQVIERFPLEFQKLYLLIGKHFQISAGQKQAPDCLLISIQLLIHNLLVYVGAQHLPAQQPFKVFFYSAASLPDQLSHQAVGAGIGPVGCQDSCV